MLIKFFRQSPQEDRQRDKVLLQLKKEGIPIENICVEACFYVSTKDGKPLNDNDELKVMRILGDGWFENMGISIVSQLYRPGRDSDGFFLEIGPRLNFSTPWSTNCVSICHSIGVLSIDRVEKSTIYWFQGPLLNQKHKGNVLESLYDPMTETVYGSALDSFDVNVKPQQWSIVDIMQEGRAALERVNAQMGLGFDDWDLDYYTKLFLEKIGRNPTTVELFDLAQSNSEHSRHWFFKGIYKVTDEEKGEKILPISLFEMVESTNSSATTNDNNVVKFCDNSSGLEGWSLLVLVSADPTSAAPFKLLDKKRHIVFTAETHNFPTGVSPFSGATTGTGGRIRDVQAVGRGGHVIAGTAGYCFGNLRIPGYPLEWEQAHLPSPANFATPLKIAIEASNGASDYGNKFGEPVITGFARSFGGFLESESSRDCESNRERREWIKPIMFSGGLGSLDDDMIDKVTAAKGHLVLKAGGPVYRIGVGGGAASSVDVQGDGSLYRDLNAVQRGDAEMEQKLNRLLRGCLEQFNNNPILAIHDQGAGGNANVLKELVEGPGGKIFTKSFSVGDPTLSTLELWGAEYQESNAMLISRESTSLMSMIAARERCPVDYVGIVTGDHKICLVESEMNLECSLRDGYNQTEQLQSISNQPEETTSIIHPVNLELEHVLGAMPKKVFEWTKQRILPKPLDIDGSHQPIDALKRILKLPSVASKRYLTNKVDRSVGGLIAQQQCVGPFHTPLADVAVCALSHFSSEGAATSIGEQPIKLLVDPERGARMTVFEALTNIASCLITDLKDIKCSANWMWPAKLPGEGYALYQACEAMCEVMKRVGIAVDGGKDSLSMAARVADPKNDTTEIVKAPGSLVISNYAPCPDITKVITPDIKSPFGKSTGSLFLLKMSLGNFRVGGSALAQVYGQIGSDCPDLESSEVEQFVKAFRFVQSLNKNGKILSLHDVSDGGIAVCLIEMAIAGWGGIEVNLPTSKEFNSRDNAPCSLTTLFNEEVGWVVEVSREEEKSVVEIAAEYGLSSELLKIGRTTEFGGNQTISISSDDQLLLKLPVADAAKMWEETSFNLELFQTDEDCAKQEFEAIEHRKFTQYHIPFEWRKISLNHTTPYVPQVAVIREEGTNGDREMAAAFMAAGFIVHDVNMVDLSRLDNLGGFFDQFRGIVFPGGFSYADTLGSAKGWSLAIGENEKLRAALESWKENETHFSLGVCNGCQLMAYLGWVGDAGCSTSTVGETNVRVVANNSDRFESRWSRITIEKDTHNVLLDGMEGSSLGVWVSHGEGKFIYKNEAIEQETNSTYVAMRYADDENQPTEKYPHNPNGSKYGVAGLSSRCGRHLALMPHPERCFLTWQWPFSPNHSTNYQQKTGVDQASPWMRMFQNAFDWCCKTRK